MIEDYYKILDKNKELFENAHEIAKEIAIKARRLFKDCKVYITGSFARKEHKLSSDLDILIVSNEIPKKIEFRWYCNIVKALTEDPRVNIHLVNKEKFKELERLYSPRIEIL